ncbi:hypothetical protein RHMOL_Rhmol03G0231400 [Rhododendron molle]|uniref:Uncharacterized protein n=1 Tax=Rhododendron molle TaxID=49168 RepID=A0ACC0PH64_RHOML|nr:hypothetical protein RHMOL_Rhmol03G0231400 [Rhododendron molle]
MSQGGRCSGCCELFSLEGSGSGILQVQLRCSSYEPRGDAAVASVLRNWKGVLVDGRVGRAKVASPLLGELLAIRLACEMTQSTWDFKCLHRIGQPTSYQVKCD